MYNCVIKSSLPILPIQVKHCKLKLVLNGVDIHVYIFIKFLLLYGTFSYCNHRIRKFSADGKFLMDWGTASTSVGGMYINWLFSISLKGE